MGIREEQIVDRYMARINKIGAENTFVAIPGNDSPIIIREALLNYIDDVVDGFEDIRFHFKNLDEINLINNEQAYISVNPYEMKWMKKTEFITDDLASRKTINLRVALKNPKTYSKLNELFTLLTKAINEIDRDDDYD